MAPYGTWTSPLSADLVAGEPTWKYTELATDGDAVYWIEARPREGGRDALVVKRPGEAPRDVADFSVRTRVHEYGGGAYTVDRGVVYASNDADSRLYRDGEPITPEGARYADLRVHDGAVFCVRERGKTNELVRIDPDGIAVIAGGRDFYSSPRVSPDGRELCWLTWDHPKMPWDGNELWVSRLDGTEARRVAGDGHEAIVQPEWSPSGSLHFSSDRSGWWNLYRDDYEPLTAIEGEIGGPLWVFGERWYGFLGERIALVYTRDGHDHLAVLEDGELRGVDTGLTRIHDFATDGARALFVGASPTRSARVLAADLDSGELEVLSEDGPEAIDPAYVSVAQAFDYETTGGRTAHALFYPPHNPDFTAPDGERPPLVVRVHGGPTAQATSKLSLNIQYFTTRGFAVVDVNYGGSSGYGREYRDRLRGQWGIVDTEDAVNAARALAAAGEADGARMAITGGSAGGWTVLCALAFHDVFAVGADYFGVTDVSDFGEDTHKFESHYDDWLIGDAAELRRERSPLFHADRIRAPVIVLQGEEDLVVPPSQSEKIVAALARNGIEHRYLTFPGEQHGFRRAENIRAALEAELAFYAKVLNLPATGAAGPST